ncbi:MCE family protein [Actinomadura sp. 21ATH]|uniref:MCE family protein n=1 Tax=Actinomadura sp. 21ATH TaxID=1735444 RepID=UPI0035BFC5D1
MNGAGGAGGPNRDEATAGERLRYGSYGLAAIAALAASVVLVVAIYNKAFTPVTRVTLLADRAGMQLLPRSDVKLRGLIVGEVRSIRARPGGAALDLALDPARTPLVPGDVSARLLPKTLLGEKYVDLVPPAGALGRPVHRPLRDGDVIGQDRSATAVELTRVLDDLMPVLRTLRPDKVNATLNALATALRGRGERLGRTIEGADAYLRRLRPLVPDLLHDIEALGRTADVYGDAAPDLARLLRDLTPVARAVVAERTTLATMLREATGAAGSVRGLLDRDEDHIAGVNIAGRRPLALLARYSPTFPCVVQGLVALKPRLDDAIGGAQPGVRATVELVRPRPAYEKGRDEPRYDDRRGPRCYGLPRPADPFPHHRVLDGVQPGARGAPDSPWPDGRLLRGALAPALGVPSEQVPDIAELLFGPLARGTVVTVR